MKLNNSLTNFIAALLLGFCFVLAILSIKNMSLTMDEKAHIPAGYSYLSQRDFRLNPEHPPLAKDLSALPLLFLNLNFPTNYSAWKDDVNGQWDMGNKFIFHSGNDADQIIFWARLPMILLLILTGWFVFFWTKKLGGSKPALLALALFCFCPTFMAHGGLVTTDVAAAFGALTAVYFWLKFLKNPNIKNIFLAGIILGIALCLKFSLILLIPALGLTTIIYACLKAKGSSLKLKFIFSYLGKSIIAGLVAIILIIWPIYQFHISNYPIERQISDTEITLGSNDSIFKIVCLWMAEKPILRPLAHYILGLTMATQRVAGGNTVYFLGMVSGNAWWYYFPVMYLLKMPLAFHLLTLLILLLWLWSIKKTKISANPRKQLSDWILKYFPEFSLLIFFVVYWVTSITGNLNIGVRHILPTLPIMYVLVALGFFRLVQGIQNKKTARTICAAVTILMIWYVASSVLAFPHYISYYNELVGGSKNGYKYAVDSNYDWGQDLKRLADFVEKNNIQQIRAPYFGGDDTKYRLGNKLKADWVPADPNEIIGHQEWLAISATFLQEGRAKPAPGCDKNTTFFNWLNAYQPIGRAGHSIFIYYIE